MSKVHNYPSRQSKDSKLNPTELSVSTCGYTHTVQRPREDALRERYDLPASCGRNSIVVVV